MAIAKSKSKASVCAHTATERQDRCWKANRKCHFMKSTPSDIHVRLSEDSYDADTRESTYGGRRGE